METKKIDLIIRRGKSNESVNYFCAAKTYDFPEQWVPTKHLENHYHRISVLQYNISIYSVIILQNL